jgi:hypothetical protein
MTRLWVIALLVGVAAVACTEPARSPNAAARELSRHPVAPPAPRASEPVVQWSSRTVWATERGEQPCADAMAADGKGGYYVFAWWHGRLDFGSVVLENPDDRRAVWHVVADGTVDHPMLLPAEVRRVEMARAGPSGLLALVETSLPSALLRFDANLAPRGIEDAGLPSPFALTLLEGGDWIGHATANLSETSLVYAHQAKPVWRKNLGPSTVLAPAVSGDGRVAFYGRNLGESTDGGELVHVARLADGIVTRSFAPPVSMRPDALRFDPEGRLWLFGKTHDQLWDRDAHGMPTIDTSTEAHWVMLAVDAVGKLVAWLETDTAMTTYAASIVDPPSGAWHVVLGMTYRSAPAPALLRSSFSPPVVLAPGSHFVRVGLEPLSLSARLFPNGVGALVQLGEGAFAAKTVDTRVTENGFLHDYCAYATFVISDASQ